jgi:hypothetical protein
MQIQLIVPQGFKVEVNAVESNREEIGKLGVRCSQRSNRSDSFGELAKQGDSRGKAKRVSTFKSRPLGGKL